jgi:uracil-DNA glycosylase family 4
MTLLDQVAGAQLKVLRPSGGCYSCPRKRVDFVPATLTAGQIIWLGEAPGKNEVLEQEGFVGESGKLLRKEAKAACVPEPWSFSNTTHCRPPNNDEPDPKSVQCCLSQFVLDEIRGYPIVVLVGAVPLKALFPGAKGSHFRGNFAHHPDFPSQRFYAIWHPSYLLRRPDLMDQWRRQLERLARAARGEPAQAWTSVRSNVYEAL